MNTIAITVDLPTLRELDRLVRDLKRNRSALVREAVRQFVDRENRRRAEGRDAEIVHRHRKQLAREAAALLKDQAKR